MGGAGRRRGGRLGLAAAGGAVLLLAACGAPSPDDVIPDGSPAQDGGWCAVLTDDDVAALVGPDQVERVRQGGELARTRTTTECSVYWADGDEYELVATVRAISAAEPNGGDMPTRRILPVLGEDGSLVADGTTAHLGDGVFRTDEEVVTWTVLGPDDDAPGLAELSLYLPGDVPGDLSEDRLTEIGERMQSMTAGLVDWQGPARPFEPEDLASFLPAPG